VSGVVLAGFYILLIADLRTPLWVAPTAFGIVINSSAEGHKLELHGQVVVSIRHTGPTILQGLTFGPV
jgi:hypothetical protein